MDPNFQILDHISSSSREYQAPCGLSGWLSFFVTQVLLATGVGQIRYLNRALMKFDSKVVIPTQFVLFNFTAIVGSAVLYRDFDSIPFQRMVIFLYGCAATFLGVFVLARPNSGGDEVGNDQRGDEESEIGSVHPPSLYRATSFSPAHTQQSLPFPTPESPSLTIRGGGGLPPSNSGASQPMRPHPSGSLRLRTRTSSTTIGLSPAKYLLLATGTTPPTANSNVASSMPIIAMPIMQRSQSQSTPQGSYAPTSRLASGTLPGSGRESRSPSRDRDGGGDSGTPNIRRSRVNTVE